MMDIPNEKETELIQENKTDADAAQGEALTEQTDASEAQEPAPAEQTVNEDPAKDQAEQTDKQPAAWKKSFKSGYGNFAAFFDGKRSLHTVITLIALPIILTLVVEMLSRNSFLAGIRFMYQSPVPFVVNCLIIACTVFIAPIFKRRFFVYLIVSAFWIVLGFVNRTILLKRVTPFNGTDIFMIKTGFRIVGKYYSPATIVLWVVMTVAVLTVLVLVWLKGPRVTEKINRVRNGIIWIAVIALTFIGISVSIDTGKIASTFNNLPNAYKAYGFNYCFLNSVFDNGVRKPSDYSSNGIIDLVDDLEEQEPVITQVTEKTPNVIIVQLESFFDVTRMGNLQFSEDPIPNFRALGEQFNTGYVSVPSIGAGTSNTEFEVLTGMNLEDFGAGEIPYKGVLLKETCESMAYNLSANGYTAHAIHNNDATFYQRHTVYPNLGFDTFTSMEYMYLTSRDFTQKKWVKDAVLTQYIQDCMDYTPDSVDFVFTISVEGHGSYPNQMVAGMNTVQVTSEEGENDYAVQYYTNLLHDMDKFVQELVDMLEARGEETILFLYGDHLPSLGLEQAHMTDGTLMQMEYVIWNNMGLDLEFGDIETYQVMPEILGALGIKTGVINNYHQTHIGSDREEYLSGLQNLEYDLLYGAKAALEETGPYVMKDMRYGVKDVTITEVYQRSFGEDTYIYAEGENFTKWSMFNINGDYYKTEIIGPTKIRAKYDDLLPQDEIFVAQVGDDKYQLSRTESYIYQ